MIASITWVASEQWGLELLGMVTTSFHCGRPLTGRAIASSGSEAVGPLLAMNEVYPAARASLNASRVFAGSRQA